MKIKFGTDGWRAIIAKDFTVENVARVTEGVVSWLKKNFESPSVVVGHDCRFAGDLFVETISKILIKNNIKVYQAKEPFVTTPMISLGTLHFKASLGIIITASHNPPSYNGYKLKGHYGGPLLPEQVKEVENLIPDKVCTDFESVNLQESSLFEIVDLEEIYYQRIT
ncbi:MAG: phosphoglucomutase/phosphomannomutase family protein, partial [Bacteroidetes bacterium]